MSINDAESTALLDAVRDAFDGVSMTVPVEGVVAAGRARRRRRRFVRAVSVAAVGAAAVAVAVLPGSTAPPAAPPAARPHLNIKTAAYVVAKGADGTVKVTWTKQGYFDDSSGLQAALRHAGFPALVKVGEFCQGPDDNGYLDPSGVGRGVAQVMVPSTDSDGHTVFTFNTNAMPADSELFIGYLSGSQLAVTHGLPGSVERLVPTNTPLTCTTQAPPAHS